MKKYLLFTASFLFITTISLAQNKEVYHFPKEDNFQVYSDCFNELRDIKDKAEARTAQYEADVDDYKKGRFCSDCKRSASRIEREDHISFEDHIKQGERSGRKITAATKQMYDDLYKNYLADWNPLKQQYDQKLTDCQGKVKTAENDANSAVNLFTANYNEASLAVVKVKDPQERATLQQKLYNANAMFEQCRQQAYRQIADKQGDSEATVAKIKEQNNIVLNLMNDIGTASNSVKTAIVDPVKANGAIQQSILTYRTKATDNKPSATTSPSQKQANNYINAANASTDDIQKAMNLNLAKINATASGNKAQVAQIQQVQSQQITQNINTLGNQLIALLSAPSRSAHILRDDEEQLRSDEACVRIDKQVSADIGFKNGIIGYDKYSNAIRATDVVVNNEKQNIDGYEMYNNGVWESGEYHNPQKALEWFTKAAEKNYPDALVRLAKKTETDNKKLSALLYLKAALLVDSAIYKNDGGNQKTIDDAMFKTALNYKYGNFDSNTNYKQALYWYSKSENNDLYIGELLEQGDNTLPKDINQATAFYKKAAGSSTNSIAKSGLQHLAQFYENGIGVEKNLDEAILCYEKVIQKADPQWDKEEIKAAKKSIKRCKEAKK